MRPLLPKDLTNQNLFTSAKVKADKRYRFGAEEAMSKQVQNNVLKIGVADD